MAALPLTTTAILICVNGSSCNIHHQCMVLQQLQSAAAATSNATTTTSVTIHDDKKMSDRKRNYIADRPTATGHKHDPDKDDKDKSKDYVVEGSFSLDLNYIFLFNFECWHRSLAPLRLQLNGSPSTSSVSTPIYRPLTADGVVTLQLTIEEASGLAAIYTFTEGDQCSFPDDLWLPLNDLRIRLKDAIAMATRTTHIDEWFVRLGRHHTHHSHL
jgi:hypothetical protein